MAHTSHLYNCFSCAKFEVLTIFNEATTEKTAFANYYSNDIIGLARNLLLRLARVLRCRSEALTEYGAEHGNTGEEETDGSFEIDS